MMFLLCSQFNFSSHGQSCYKDLPKLSSTITKSKILTPRLQRPITYIGELGLLLIFLTQTPSTSLFRNAMGKDSDDPINYVDLD